MPLAPTFWRGMTLLMFATLISLSLSGNGLASENQAPLIHLQYASFDPLKNEPAVPESGRLAIPAAGLSTYLVQFAGPVLADWKAQVEQAGAVLYGYIPQYAFFTRAEPATIEIISALPFVRWVGPYHPVYRLAPTLSRQGYPQAQMLSIAVQTVPEADLGGLAARVSLWGGRLLGLASNRTAGILHLDLPAGRLQDLARVEGVLWIEPDFPKQLFNDVAGGEIIGANAIRAGLKLYGAGQVVAVADSGLDVGANDASMSADFAGRILEAYSLCEEGRRDSWNDESAHGTHVAGSALGSGKLSGSNPAKHQYGNSFAGVAPEALLIVQSIDDPSSPFLECLPDDLFTGLFRPAYTAGARIHTNSWGNPTGGDLLRPEYGGYTTESRAADTAMWEYERLLVLFAAGNSGVDANADGKVDPDSLASPGTAKNVITVGATESLRPEQPYTWGYAWPQDFPAEPIFSDLMADNARGMAAFSSRGPADDGRIKPDLVAPGTFIISARSHDPKAGIGWGVYNDHYLYMGGTSMATPLTAGAAAVAREWLAEFQGLGEASAALVKAVLINGATDLSPGQYTSPKEIPAKQPNPVSGWGRVDLLSSLNPPDPVNIWLADNTAGLYTGQRARYLVTIGDTPPAGEANAGQAAAPAGPLRLTLAWTDAPGEPAAAQALVNDLDLELVAPDGARYTGNAGLYASGACLRDEKWDACNNVEGILFPEAPAGTYTMIVRAANIPQGPQPFALVASGDNLVAGRGQSLPIYIPLVER